LKPSVLLHLYRIRLRSRIGTELLALAGVAVGVALVFAALVANASLTGSVRQLTEGIVGRADLQLAARAPGGFEQNVLRRVESVPGTTAAPLAEARVNVVGAEGRRSVLLLGGDPRRDALGGTLLGSPKLVDREAGPGLFLPAPLAAELGARAGSRVRVETGAGVGSVRVAGLLDRDEIGALAESPVALAPLPLVQRLAGMQGHLSRVFVAAARGRERAVETAMRRIAVRSRLNLGPAAQEAEVFASASYPTTKSTSLFSVLSALVGFLFALNAVLLSMPQRRRLVADLRMAGYAPSTTIWVLVVDAMLLGAAGATLGLFLGELASRQLLGGVPAYLASAFAIGSQWIVPWQSVALAAGAGLVASCLAVLVPILGSLRMSRRRQDATVRTQLGRDLVLAGAIALLTAALGLTALSPDSALLGLGLLLCSLLLFLEGWLRLTASAIRGVCGHLRSPAAILAALGLQGGGSRLRTIALAGTGAIAVFATVSIGGARSDLQRGLDRSAEDADRGAQVWIAFRGSSNIFGTAAIAIEPRQLRKVERLPGVREVIRNRGGYLDVGADRVWALGPAAGRTGTMLSHQVEDGAPALAARRLRSGGWVALSQGLASKLGVGVGDPVELPLPVSLPLRVAAVTNNFGWPGGAMVLAAPAYARAWGSDAISTLGLRVEPSHSPAALAAAVRSILGPRSGLRVETAAERTGRQKQAARAGLARLEQIAVLVLIASVLAMAASMAGVVWQRRPRFAALKLHGLSAGVLWRAMLFETALLIGAGCLAGAAFGLVGQLLLDQGLRAITGFPVVYEVAWAGALTNTLAVSIAAAAILSVPGWAAVRVRPQAGLVD
jgi:putative ABC transport system permease protein